METIARTPVTDREESRLTDRVIAEIYAAGYADGLAAVAAKPRHLRLADVTASSVTAIRQAASR